MMSEITEFEAGKSTDTDRAVLAFAQHRTAGPFDPELDATNSARQTIGDTVRETVRTFGPNRHRWPADVLAAAAPFDPVSQIAMGGVPRRRTALPPVPQHVRRHRPHNTNVGTDWRPVVPGNDLAIPSYT